jgi:hypothetical protein
MVWNRESDSLFHNVGFFFNYVFYLLQIVDSMLTFPSKLLLANSPKDTVEFGRWHEEIREHELKYTSGIGWSCIVYMIVYLGTIMGTMYTRVLLLNLIDLLMDLLLTRIPYPGYGIRIVLVSIVLQYIRTSALRHKRKPRKIFRTRVLHSVHGSLVWGVEIR